MTQPNQVAAASVNTQPSDDELAIGIITDLNPLTVNRAGGEVLRPGVLDTARTVPLAVGDTVALIREKGTWLLLGKISDSAAAQSPLMAAGQVLFTFVAQTSASIVVSFATPFSSTPSVVATIASGNGSANLWFVRAINASANGFTLLVSAAAAASWTDFPVNWQAQVMTQ